MYRKRKGSRIQCLASGLNGKPTIPHPPFLILAIHPPVTIPNHHLIVPSVPPEVARHLLTVPLPLDWDWCGMARVSHAHLLFFLHSLLEVWPSTCPHALLQPCATLPYSISHRRQRLPSANNTSNACLSSLTPSSLISFPTSRWALDLSLVSPIHPSPLHSLCRLFCLGLACCAGLEVQLGF